MPFFPFFIYLCKKIQSMKVTLVQSDIIWKDVAANLRLAETLMEEKTDSDMFVLPEMFSTGFVTEPTDDVADTGAVLEWMRSAAARYSAAIVGSVMVKQGSEYFNRMYFVRPDGSFEQYDKRHLFTYGGEHRRYSRGEDKVVVEYLGVRFLLLVCYDLRFPVWSRYETSKEYDAIIYVANWPTSRQEVWNVLLRARAMENQCYVVGVNRVGTDAACEYSGGSVVVSPYGKLIVECGCECGCASGELDMEKLRAFRAKFPVLEDRD